MERVDAVQQLIDMKAHVLPLHQDKGPRRPWWQARTPVAEIIDSDWYVGLVPGSINLMVFDIDGCSCKLECLCWDDPNCHCEEDLTDRWLPIMKARSLSGKTHLYYADNRRGSCGMFPSQCHTDMKKKARRCGKLHHNNFREPKGECGCRWGLTCEHANMLFRYGRVHGDTRSVSGYIGMYDGTSERLANTLTNLESKRLHTRPAFNEVETKTAVSVLRQWNVPRTMDEAIIAFRSAERGGRLNALLALAHRAIYDYPEYEREMYLRDMLNIAEKKYSRYKDGPRELRDIRRQLNNVYNMLS